MDQAYAIEYHDLYHRHWWWRSREEEILRVLDSRFNVRQSGNRSTANSSQREILDVGCGDGLFFDQLQKYGSVCGVEGDPHTITPGSKWRSQIHNQFFDDSFKPGQKFDAILMLDILEHMDDPCGALQHASSLLKEDGFLIATVPALMALWTSHDDLNHHVIRYSRRGFADLIESGGFKQQSLRFLFHWTCPIKLAIAAKEKLFGSVPQSPQVPAGWMNQIFLNLSRIEQATISKLPMPFGSSLIAIAEPIRESKN